jgi:hypothetical protein
MLLFKKIRQNILRTDGCFLPRQLLDFWQKMDNNIVFLSKKTKIERYAQTLGNWKFQPQWRNSAESIPNQSSDIKE